MTNDFSTLDAQSEFCAQVQLSPLEQSEANDFFDMLADQLDAVEGFTRSGVELNQRNWLTLDSLHQEIDPILQARRKRDEWLDNLFAA